MLVDNDTLQRMRELTEDLDAGKSRLEILMATHLQSRPYRAAELSTENSISSCETYPREILLDKFKYQMLYIAM